MAQEAREILAERLFCARVEDKTLTEAIKEYFKVYGQAFALLYSPKAAWLARLEDEDHFIAANGKVGVPMTLGQKDWQDVFEARIFNDATELRWLNRENGKGAAVVLCNDDSRKFFDRKLEAFKTRVDGEEKELVEAIKQTYLFWGQSVAESKDGWTKFAEARIGAFFVPVEKVTRADLDKKELRPRARFKALEYLGEYTDGNVAVAEERLTGIELA